MKNAENLNEMNVFFVSIGKKRVKKEKIQKKGEKRERDKTQKFKFKIGEREKACMYVCM